MRSFSVRSSMLHIKRRYTDNSRLLLADMPFYPTSPWIWCSRYRETSAAQFFSGVPTLSYFYFDCRLPSKSGLVDEGATGTIQIDYPGIQPLTRRRDLNYRGIHVLFSLDRRVSQKFTRVLSRHSLNGPLCAIIY